MTEQITTQELSLATEDDLFAMGFSIIPPSENLFQHPKYPGLVFKRANTFNDIKKMGGIFLFGKGGAMAYSGDFLNYGLRRPGCIRVPSTVNVAANTADGPFGDIYPEARPKSQYAIYSGIAQIVESTDYKLGQEIEKGDKIKVCALITEASSIFWHLEGTADLVLPINLTVAKQPYEIKTFSPSCAVPRTGGLMSTNMRLDVNHVLQSVKGSYIASIDADASIVALYKKCYDDALKSFAPNRGSRVIPSPVNLYAARSSTGKLLWTTNYQYNVGYVWYEYYTDPSRFVTRSAADNDFPGMPARQQNQPYLAMVMPSTSYCCTRGSDLSKTDLVGGNIPPIVCVDFAKLFDNPIIAWTVGSRYPKTQGKFDAMSTYRTLTEDACFSLDAIPYDEVALSTKQIVPVGDVFGGLSPVGRSVKKGVLNFYSQVSQEFSYLATCSGEPVSAPLIGEDMISSEKIRLVSASRGDKTGVRKAIDAMLPNTSPVVHTLQSFSNLVDLFVDKSIGNSA